jgi:hypothetical protein
VKTLHTQIEIAPPAERVWPALVDLDAHPSWKPCMPRVTGKLAPSARLKVGLEPPGGGPMTFRPTVLAAEPNNQLRW